MKIIQAWLIALFCVVSGNMPAATQLIAIDQRFSSDTQHAMALFFEQKTTSAPQEIVDKTREQFPAIKSLYLAEKASGEQQITVESFKPQVRINEQLVLCEQQMVFPSALYNESLIAQLPSLAMDDVVPYTHISSEAASFIAAMSAELYERFAITWVQPTTVLFKDKHSTDFVILGSYHTIPTPRLIQQCEDIYQDVKQQPVKQQPKKAHAVMMDIRFEKQIIAYSKEQEGV